MFTGIVQGKTKVSEFVTKPGLTSFSIQLPPDCAQNVQLGASIAVDGVCLTVTNFDEKSRIVRFDMMQETLDVTALSLVAEGYEVNFERSALMNAENGGHLVSGHVDGYAKVASIQKEENVLNVSYGYPEGLDKYLFKKGFVALNGCSLTIADIDRDNYLLKVCYIPETLEATTHGQKKVGDAINIEVDRQTQTIVETVERVLKERGLV
jgi:riboflavin synthase